MSDVKGLEQAVIEAENRVRSLMERSNSLGGDTSDGSVETDWSEELKDKMNRETIAGIRPPQIPTIGPPQTPTKDSSESMFSKPMIIGGVALLGLVAFLMLRKKK